MKVREKNHKYPDFIRLLSYLMITVLYFEYTLNGNVDYNHLGDGLEPAELSALAEITAYKIADTELEKTFSDCLRIMKSGYLEKEYARHMALALEYSRTQDARLKNELLESQRLQNEIRQLYGN